MTCHTSSYNSAFFNGRFSSIDDSVINELEDYARNYADVSVYVSHALRDQLAKQSIYGKGTASPAKVVVLPNFVYGDVYDFMLVKQEEIPTDR